MLMKCNFSHGKCENLNGDVRPFGKCEKLLFVWSGVVGKYNQAFKIHMGRLEWSVEKILGSLRREFCIQSPTRLRIQDRG